MPHVNFDPNSVDWRGFFAQPQVGGAYFHGVPYMRGHGIGAVFKNLYRFLLPLASSAGKAIGREGLSVGARILGDIASGEEPKSALSVHTREGIKNLMHKATHKLDQKGSGRKTRKSKKHQKGRGTTVQTYRTTSRSKKKRKAHSVSDLFSGRSLSEPPPTKQRKKRRQRVDSLGIY